MTTLKASGLKAFLDQAKGNGTVEEAATISGLPIVVKSLPPGDYVDILAAVSELEGGPEYMYEWQIEHLCRALVEVGGQDFRDVEFITVEREDPKTHQVVEVNVLRHEWLKDNLIRTWTREFIHVAFRKFLDACEKAAVRAREGVEFYVKEETDEEQFRRLLADALEAGEALPDDMKESILKEASLLTATSAEELEAINEQARRYMAERQAAADALDAEEQLGAPEEEEPPPPPRAPQRAAAPPIEDEEDYQVPVRAPQELVEASRRQAAELMASRSPLNREAIQPPVPYSEETQVHVVNPRPAAPHPSQVAPPLMSRAARMAALEAQAGQDGGVPIDPRLLEEGYHSLPGSEHEGVLEKPLTAEPASGSTVVGKQKLHVDGGPIVRKNPLYVDPRKNMGISKNTGGIDPRNRPR